MHKDSNHTENFGKKTVKTHIHTRDFFHPQLPPRGIPVCKPEFYYSRQAKLPNEASNGMVWGEEASLVEALLCVLTY